MRLGGSLDCGLVRPRRRVIDLTANVIGGAIPPCFVAAPVEELYLGRCAPGAGAGA